ncbi:MAG: tetratricopeptide repeat protein [Candidatus Aminicenantes bacterium]|nr:MAG: tetratricopeptide repeat protein [Candidatus Aminicenantes bacterium]
MEHIGFYLRDIYFHKKSGPLIFKYEGLQRYLFFHDGFLVFAKITHPQELLGEVLFKLGKISRSTYSKIDSYIDPTLRLGESLMKEGLLSEDDLYAGLRYQMREITLNIFPFFDGKFRFQERGKFAEEEFKSKITIPDLIEEGIRRIKYYSKLEKFMVKKVLFPKSEDFIDRLTGEERKIIGTIDGSFSAEDLFHSGDFEPKFFWKSLYLSYCLNIIDIMDPEKVPVKKEKAEKATFEVKDKKLAEVIAMSEQLSTMDYYQILNIPEGSSPYQIKLSYFRLTREYHPGCFSKDLPSDIKDKIEDVFGHITKAYDTLGDEKKKQEYDSKREASPVLGGKELEKKADIKYRQGRTLYNQERYDEALKLLEEAVRLKKNKGVYFLVLAMAKSKVPPFHKKAEEAFQKAIKLEPSNPEFYVGLGTYYKEEGFFDKAKKQFKKALEIDPENKIALKELGLTEKLKKKGLTGIFKHLGKKKKKR